MTLWSIGGYGGSLVPIFSLSVPIPLQLSFSVSLQVEGQLSALCQPRSLLPVEAVTSVQSQAVRSRQIFSPDAALSARASRVWQTIH